MKRFFITLLLLFVLFPVFSSNNLNLVSESEKLGLNIQWDSLSESGIIEKSGHRISFHVDDPFVLQDFKKLSLCDAPELKNGVIYVSQRFLDNMSEFLIPDFEDNPYKVSTILIDPGHGGKDPGAIGTHTINGKKVSVIEKDINLKASLLLYNKLKTEYPDKKILLTRSTDITLPLDKRPEIANSVKLKDNETAIFISIHSNSNPDSRAKGYEVWYLSPEYRRTLLEESKTESKEMFAVENAMLEEAFTMESKLISKFVMDGIQEQVGSSVTRRDVKYEEWFVIRNSNMPAVLIELGFVTNTEESKKLTDESYLKKLSLGIYNGIKAYITHYESSRGFTNMQ